MVQALSRARVVVLASGKGSNFRAIQTSIEEGRCAAEIVGLLVDRGSAPARIFAEHKGIPCRLIRFKDFDGRSAWDRALAEAALAWEPDLVVLAGFMKIVGPAMLSAFPDRILNVHPSLLPAFPGLNAAQQAVDAGVRISGCTIHRVDAGVDTGPILAQVAVPVLPDDDAASLHARIQRAEHRALPWVVNWCARAMSEGSLQWEVSPEGASDILAVPSMPAAFEGDG